MAGSCGRTLIDILAIVATCGESSLAGAGVGPHRVETRGVYVARVVLAFVHIDAVHVSGRTVVPNAAGALERPVGVPALFVYSAGIVNLHALVDVLTKSLIRQGEPWLTQAGEGTLAVHTGGIVFAASVVMKALVDVATLGCAISRISYLARAVVGAGEIEAESVGVTLLHEGALVHISAGEAIALVACCTLAGEGAGGIGTYCEGAATPLHALVQVVALGAVKDKSNAAVTIERPSGIDAGGGRWADVWCRTLINILTRSPVSHKPAQTRAFVAPESVNTDCTRVTLIVSATFVYVCARQAVADKASVAGALVGAHGVHTVRIQTTDVVGAFIDIHAALAVAFEACAACTAVAAWQIPATPVAECGRAHTWSL